MIDISKLATEVSRIYWEIKEETLKEFLATVDIHSPEELKEQAHRGTWVIFPGRDNREAFVWDRKVVFSLEKRFAPFDVKIIKHWMMQSQPTLHA